MVRIQTILAALCIFLLSGTVHASSIKPLDLAELSHLSNAIVTAKVISARPVALDSRILSPHDEITIQVVSVLIQKPSFIAQEKEQ